ncbi:hypothetical protein FHW79_006068 [Azospirillum sp. OGB3]|uniref:hypothetical protein n=1 Tax=Azospirillum sp. OGB3 TaxID=2587012 RepID=UPI001606E223|nr:hypothetical protein [Azospirillum sp. OGB3]MBB3268393.1 hypothetical protein [Azospirillum sp. OGB3]
MSERRPRGYTSISYGFRPPMAAPPRASLSRRVLTVAAAAWLAIVPIGLMTSQPARALFGVGDVVFDPANFAESVKGVVQAAQTVAQVTQLVTVATRIVNAFGEGGPIAGLLALGGVASDYGLLDGVSMGQETKDALNAAGSALKAGGNLYNEIGKLSKATDRLDRALGQAGSWSDSRPRFPGWDIIPTLGHYSTTTASRGFTYEFLSAWAAHDPATARIVESRGRIEREVGALELHSTSIFNGFAASKAADRNRELLQQAQSAKNGREQGAAQLAATMALLEETQRLNAQMAVIGRFQAAQYLGGRNLSKRPGGGEDALWMAPGTAPTTGDGLAQAILPPTDTAGATP